MKKYEVCIKNTSPDGRMCERYTKAFKAKNEKSAGSMAIKEFQACLPFEIAGEKIEVESVTLLKEAKSEVK